MPMRHVIAHALVAIAHLRGPLDTKELAEVIREAAPRSQELLTALCAFKHARREAAVLDVLRNTDVVTWLNRCEGRSTLSFAMDVLNFLPFPACRLHNACRARMREVVGPHIHGCALETVFGFPGAPVDRAKALFAEALARSPASDYTARQYESIMKAVNSSIDVKDSAVAVGLIGRKLYYDMVSLRNP